MPSTYFHRRVDVWGTRKCCVGRVAVVLLFVEKKMDELGGQLTNEIHHLDARIERLDTKIELLNTKIESHVGSPLLLAGYVELLRGYGKEREGYVEEREGYVATRALLRDAVAKAKIGRMGQQSLNDGL
jgi:hypothetical protein